MAARGGDGDVRRRETDTESADRRFGEILQELRVSQTGVQILFAFLLTLAFQSRFTDIDRLQLWTYVVTLLLCACAAAFLIAPVALHRTMSGLGRKQEVVAVAGRLAQGGLLMLFLAIVGAILFILDVVLSRGLAFGLAGGVVVVFLTLWYVVPVVLAQVRKG